MELPVSFADYTRTLLGDEDYKELVTSLESEQSVSIITYPVESAETFCFPLRRTCRSLVYFRFLPGRTPDIYF